MGHRTSRQRTRKPKSDEAEEKPHTAASSSAKNAWESTDCCRSENIDRTPDMARSVESETPIQRDAGAQYGTGQREPEDPDRGYVEYAPGPDRQDLSDRYGFDVRGGQARTLQRLETKFGTDQVRRWADEGMTVETMGKPRDMQAFRERQAERPEEVPADIERQHEASLQRNTATNGTIQPTLRVSDPDDPAEREADRVAEQVMDAADERNETTNADRSDPQSGGDRSTSTSRPTTIPTENQPSRSDESPHSGRASGEQQAVEGVERALQSTSGGKPLSPATRSFFEPRFGRDFGDVRVHTGKEAADLNRTVNAKAFTHGSDVYFGEGQYRPESTDGKKLMAHELTHVVQQSGRGRRLSATRIHRNNNGNDDGNGNDNGEVPIDQPEKADTIEDLFEKWVEEGGDKNTEKLAGVLSEVKRRLGYSDDKTLEWWLQNNEHVQHARGYWLREAIRTRLPQEEKEKPGVLVEQTEVEARDGSKEKVGPAQIFIRSSQKSDNPRYEAKIRKDDSSITGYIPQTTVQEWTAAVDPESSVAEIEEELEAERDDSASGTGESNEGETERAAKRRKMVSLAQEKWDKDIGDTSHRLPDPGTVYVGKRISKIDIDNVDEEVSIIQHSNYQKALKGKTKAVVKGNPKQPKEVKESVGEIINIFVETGGAWVLQDAKKYMDKGGKMAWCGRFVGSLAEEIGVEKSVLETALASTPKLYEAGEEGRYGEQGKIEEPPSDTMPETVHHIDALTRVDGPPQPGDILTVKEEMYWGKDVGGHIVLAADPPKSGHVPTVEGNGTGWQPDGEWTQGVVERFRSLESIRMKYRLTKDHF